MFLKNILLGISGSVAIGGIGYGIYASSQSNDEEKTITGEQAVVTKPETKADVDNGDSTHKEEGSVQNSDVSPKPEVDSDTTIGNNGASGEESPTSGGTTPGTLPTS